MLCFVGMFGLEGIIFYDCVEWDCCVLFVYVCLFDISFWSLIDSIGKLVFDVCFSGYFGL